MYKFLVTGGAGFIGSNLCERLVREGHEVRLLDDLSTGKEDNLAGFIDSVEFIKGDLRNISTVKKAVKGVDYVVHLGALSSVPMSIEDPLLVFDVNCNGTLNVLAAAREAAVKKVVYASSCAVYGDGAELPKREDMTPAPLSPYAVSKLTSEYYCQSFYRSFGLKTVSMRYFNIFGKRQSPDSAYAAVLPKFISALMKNERPVIYGDGEQTRDFMYVEDCNRANVAACLADGCAGVSINVGYGASHSINEMLEKVKKGMGRRVAPVYSGARAGDIRDSVASVERLKKVLSFAPEFTLDDAVEQTVGYYLALADDGLPRPRG